MAKKKKNETTEDQAPDSEGPPAETELGGEGVEGSNVTPVDPEKAAEAAKLAAVAEDSQADAEPIATPVIVLNEKQVTDAASMYVAAIRQFRENRKNRSHLTWEFLLRTERETQEAEIRRVCTEGPPSGFNDTLRFGIIQAVNSRGSSHEYAEKCPFGNVRNHARHSS